MEDTLRDTGEFHEDDVKYIVLILVLMEDTLRELEGQDRKPGLRCLNPCFNGRYSQSIKRQFMAALKIVLILVLMEDTLRENSVVYLRKTIKVLILVLMEDTLRGRGE